MFSHSTLFLSFTASARGWGRPSSSCSSGCSHPRWAALAYRWPSSCLPHCPGRETRTRGKTLTTAFQRDSRVPIIPSFQYNFHLKNGYEYGYRLQAKCSQHCSRENTRIESISSQNLWKHYIKVGFVGLLNCSNDKCIVRLLVLPWNTQVDLYVPC